MRRRVAVSGIAIGIVVALVALASAGWWRSRSRMPAPAAAVTDPETLAHLSRQVVVRVRGGLEEDEDLRADVAQIVADELGAEDAALEAALLGVLDTEIARVRAAERTWTSPTTNDAIDRAFEELDASGIVALQGAGYTMSDGWDDVAEEADRRGGARGAVFYHGQDLERGVDGEGLMLAFGQLESETDDVAATIAIGREVCAALERHGIAHTWDGSAEQRISIAPFEWRRRHRPL